MDAQQHKQTLLDVDRRIVELLRERFAICGKAVAADRGAAVCDFDPVRERRLLEQLSEHAGPTVPPETLRAIYREILSGAMALNRDTTVAFLGPPGTFTHQAALTRFGRSVRYNPYQSIAETFDAVVRKEVAFGVVPVENSTEGAVTYTLDMFMDSQVRICAEINLSIHHHLMSRTPREGIRRLYSHPQVFGQCRRWIRENLGAIPLVETASTTEAVARCLDDDEAGALAGELAGELNGVPILERNVEDFSHNTTRFFVLGREEPEPTGDDRTSILFAVRDRVGALYDSLQPLGRHNISLTFIESRPSKRRSWEYVFFVDFQGHVSDPKVKTALEELHEHCQFVRVLGSYPRAQQPE